MALYLIFLTPEFKKDFSKLDKQFQIHIYKKIKKISSLQTNKHLKHSLPYFVEKSADGSRLVYILIDNKLTIIRFFKTHKEYTKWLK